MIAGSPIRWTNPTTWPWFIYAWITFALIGWGKPAWKWLQRKRAAEWPSTEGRIESTSISKPGFSFLSRRAPCEAKLAYSYFSMGERYSGSYRRAFYTEDEAEVFIRGVQDKPVNIHTDPVKPSRSALLEQDVERLLLDRPAVESKEVRGRTGAFPKWIQPFLWFFTGLSGVGLFLSLWVHLGALLGERVAPETFFWGLHIGIFVVWIPSIFVARQLVGNPSRNDFWKAVLRGSPDWMRYMVYGFIGYAVVNFGLFMMEAPSGGGGSNPPAVVWRGFSGHWMAFYSAAFAILLSAARAERNNGRLPNGEWRYPYREHCPRCGKLDSECHCFSPNP